jgi:hypothetical protein
LGLNEVERAILLENFFIIKASFQLDRFLAAAVRMESRKKDAVLLLT